MSYIGAQPTTAAFVTDTFSANGSGTVFTLSVAPANTNSILVAVSGVLQDPSTYSVSGTTLTFSAAPPAGTGNISVRFLGIPASGVVNTAYRTQTEFTATAGQTTFSVPSYTVGYIDVYRNGALLGSADFTATNGTTVVLAAGASAGDLIETVSFYVSSVLNAIPAVANAVTDSYINSGAVTQAKFGTNVVGNGPAFGARASGNQSITTGTWTKINLTNEQFDTNNNFASSRFTPTVAGYYQINGATRINGTSMTLLGVAIYFNGTERCVTAFPIPSSTNQFQIQTNSLIYFNGSTDYVELYGLTFATSPSFDDGGGFNTSLFNGSLVRAA